MIAVIAVVITVAAASGAGLALTQKDTPKADPVVVAHDTYVHKVDSVLQDMGRQQTAQHKQLDAAESQQAQQEAALGLAQLYATTGDRLEPIKPPAADAVKHKALLDTLENAHTQYAALAKAAKDASAVDFYKAAASGLAAETNLDRAIKAVYGEQQ